MEENQLAHTNSSSQVSTAARIESVCANCKRPLATSDRFCNDCGAKVIDKRLTMGFLFTEAKESFFSLDSNRPLLTFIHLFTRPEEVIGGYINGVRRKYINAFGYFTIAITLSSFFYFVIFKLYPNAFDALYANQDFSDPQIQMQQEIQRTIFEYQSVIFFVAIPFLALLSRLVFLKNKRYNFAEHLIINLYGYAQVSIVSIMVYSLTAWSPEIFRIAIFSAFAIQLGYYFYILKRLFEISWKKMIIKTLVFLAILVPIYIGVSILVFAILAITGAIDFQEMIEAERAKRAVSYIASSVINWTS
ncbi:DUF3667 domain-containing protein [Jejudonia soesokkakensis]|uniref:DUF3667 domain-containing protein n=1 Tax=Jejudonia soesokkakensis TaxID=1323432 RepID=A0ABW2MWV2_9FLAO